jgi:L-malate glycosyltransferase
VASHPPIKVCHLASGDLWAGAEVQLFTLLESLLKEESLALSVILLNPGKLADKLNELGIEITVLSEKETGFKKLRCQVIERLLTINPDIVHTHRYKENILAATSKRKCRIKYLVQTVHGIGEPVIGLVQQKSRIYDLINKACTRIYFDKVIAVSADIQSRLNGVYSANKIVAIHNGIDPDKIMSTRSAAAVRNEFQIASGDPIIGVIGRMVRVKAYDKFLLMAREVLKSYPNAKFFIVGDGPLKAELENKAAQLEISQSVFFTGFRNDIYDFVNALDVFVISSIHEGIPMVLLEAMALKKAIVSTAVGGIIEVLVDGVSGLLVKSGQPDDIADACFCILKNNDLKVRLGNEARRRLDAEFSINMLRNRMLGLYNQLM